MFEIDVESCISKVSVIFLMEKSISNLKEVANISQPETPFESPKIEDKIIAEKIEQTFTQNLVTPRQLCLISAHERQMNIKQKE